MGAWGIGPFDNDDACDFLAELRDCAADKRDGKLTEALAAVTEDDGYLEAPTVSVAIAAAVIIANALAGKSLHVDDEDVAALLGAHQADLLRMHAASAIRRALDEDRNELLELWNEGGSTQEFREAVLSYVAAPLQL